MSQTISLGDLILTFKTSKFSSFNYNQIVSFEMDGRDFGETIFIKRVVGTPRDTIFFKRNFIIVNCFKIPHDSIFEMLVEESNYPDSTEFYNAAVYSEYLLNRSNLADQSKYVIENGNAIIIPDDHYFMVGDNHYESMDSRFWGFIPKENIKGKVVWVF